MAKTVLRINWNNINYDNKYIYYHKVHHWERLTKKPHRFLDLGSRKASKFRAIRVGYLDRSSWFVKNDNIFRGELNEIKMVDRQR